MNRNVVRFIAPYILDRALLVPCFPDIMSFILYIYQKIYDNQIKR